MSTSYAFRDLGPLRIYGPKDELKNFPKDTQVLFRGGIYKVHLNYNVHEPEEENKTHTVSLLRNSVVSTYDPKSLVQKVSFHNANQIDLRERAMELAIKTMSSSINDPELQYNCFGLLEQRAEDILHFLLMGTEVPQT